MCYFFYLKTAFTIIFILQINFLQGQCTIIKVIANVPVLAKLASIQQHSLKIMHCLIIPEYKERKNSGPVEI